MSGALDPRLQRLLDRQDILDCLSAYCRGTSRLDADLIRSVYHDDGLHCTVNFTGSREEFIEWYWSLRSAGEVRSTAFYSTTESIDFDGDTAHVESHYLCVVNPAEGDAELAYGGRYVDRFERREGVWRIAVRVVIGEWSTTWPRPAGVDMSIALGRLASRDRGDISYERPLRPPPPA